VPRTLRRPSVPAAGCPRRPSSLYAYTPTLTRLGFRPPPPRFPARRRHLCSPAVLKGCARANPPSTADLRR
jgi:hypothetical protein